MRPVRPFSEFISLEGRLLVLCARTHAHSHHVEQIRQCVSQRVDWELFRTLAEDQEVRPLVFHTLRSVCPDRVPASLLEHFRQYQKITTLKNEVLAKELLQLLDGFSAQGVPVIPLKGPSLAIEAYGDLFKREFGDIDLLVSKENLPSARAILQDHGYEPKDETPRTADPEQLKLRKFHSFSKRNGLLVVDLQCQLASPNFSFSLDREVFWQNLSSLSLLGQPLPCLAPENLLMVLCIHGSKHVWSQLKWICDVAEFIHTHPHLEWELILSRCRQWHCRRIVLVGVYLAYRYFQVRLPDWLLHILHTDRDFMWIASCVPETLILPQERKVSEYNREAFYYILKDSSWDQIRYLLHLCRTDSPVITRRLPWFRDQARLRRWYFLIHPLRVAKKTTWKFMGQRT